jgi:hypothetical protein
LGKSKLNGKSIPGNKHQRALLDAKRRRVSEKKILKIKLIKLKIIN